jgi:hypothetical protein
MHFFISAYFRWVLETNAYNASRKSWWPIIFLTFDHLTIPRGKQRTSVPWSPVESWSPLFSPLNSLLLSSTKIDNFFYYYLHLCSRLDFSHIKCNVTISYLINLMMSTNFFILSKTMVKYLLTISVTVC